MPAIILTQEQTQALIAYNKQQITDLEVKQKEIKNCIDNLWKASDPMDISIASTTAFQCLNVFKDALRKIKKQIKLLADVQSALKCSIR